MAAVSARAITTVEPLSVDRAEQAVDVLVDSFFDYPVMQYILGANEEEYEGKLRKLIRYLVSARYSRDEPVLAVMESGMAVAAAILTPPFQRQTPLSLVKYREAVWQDLGKDARSRYESLGRYWQVFTLPEPRYHLNMIGVLRSHTGSGYGRMLLDAVHDLSHGDRYSTGVSLNTEDENNLPLYEHFGYRVMGHVKAADNLHT